MEMDRPIKAPVRNVAQERFQPSGSILVVDDDEGSCYTKARILRDAGYEVHTVGTGTAALQFVNLKRPKLVVLDVHLPDMNGFEVCKRLKDAQDVPSALVLHISSTHIEGKDKVQGLEAGADSYLAEPVEPEVLLATVRALLRLQQAEEKLRVSAQQWRTTFDAISDPLALLDAAGTIVRCNEAFRALTDRPFAELIGQSVLKLERAGQPLIKERSFHTMLASSQREEFTIEMQERVYEATIHPTVEAGKVMGAVYILSDATEKQQAMGELKSSRAQLQDKVQELERFQDVVVGRELKMMDLEKQVKALQDELSKARGIGRGR